MGLVPVYLGSHDFTGWKPNVGESLALEPPTKPIALHQLKADPDATSHGNGFDMNYVPDDLRRSHADMLSSTN